MSPLLRDGIFQIYENKKQTDIRGVIKVREGLPKFMRVSREGLALFEWEFVRVIREGCS